MKTTVVVMNKPGGGGLNAANAIWRGKNDGLEMLIMHGEAATLAQLIDKGPYVSRSHATIKTQRGSFYLADHSANGTYVLYPGEAPIFLKREMLQLRNDGEISLSPIAEPTAGELIRFHCGSHMHIGAETA
jgi:hypothetical protein